MKPYLRLLVFCFVAFLAVLLSTSARAQILFCSTASGGGGWVGLTRTYDGNFVAMGGAAADFYISKTSPAGTLLWAKRYDASLSDNARTVIETYNNKLVVCGSVYDNTNLQDYFISKLDENGSMIWTRSYGSTATDEAISVIETSDYGYAVTGLTFSAGEGSSDVFVTKLDSAGNITWSVTVGTYGEEGGQEIIQTSDGGYAIAGYSSNQFGLSIFNSYVIKLSSTGAVQWTSAFGVDSPPYLGFKYSGLVEGTDGNLYCAGYGNATSTNEDLLVTKYSMSGTIIWNRFIGSPLTQRMEGAAIELSPGGNLVIGARHGSFAMLTEVTYSGMVLWTKKYGGTNNFYSVIDHGQGGFVGCGGSFYLAKTDSLGNSCCSDTANFYSIPALLLDTFGGIASNVTWSPSVTFTQVPLNMTPTFLCRTCAGVTLAATATPNVICRGDSATLTSTVTGGSPPFTYLWQPGGATTPSIVVSPSTNQTYTLTIADTLGVCSTFDTATVRVYPLSQVTGDTLLCLGDSTLLSASGGGLYTWSTGATTSSTWVRPQATTTYSVTINDVVHGCTETLTHAITVDSCEAPQFCKLEGGTLTTWGFDVVHTSDRGYAVCGFTYPPPDYSSRAYIVKFNGLGDVSWGNALNANRTSIGQALVQTPDSGYVVTGIYNTAPAVGNDVLVARYTKHGTLSWAKTVSTSEDDAGNDIILTSDGGFFIAGTRGVFSNNSIYGIKLDGSGTIQWTKLYGGTGDDQGYGVVQAADGGYVISGTTNSFGAGGNDLYVIKTDSLGAIIWTRTLGGTANDEGARILATPDGGYAIAGSSYSFGAGSSDYYVAKLDSLGNVLWSYSYGTNLRETANAITLTPDSGFVISGSSYNPSFNFSVQYLIRLDKNGNLLWTRATPGPDNREAYSSVVLNDGSITVTGLSGYTPPWYMSLVKIDPQLNSCCFGSSIAVRDSGGVISSGGTVTPHISGQGTISGTYMVGGVMDTCFVNIPTTVSPVTESFSSGLYPNPGVGTVFFRSEKAVHRIVVYNTLGGNVFEISLPEETYNGSIDLSGLAPGMYFFTMATENGPVSGKILLEH